MQPKQKNWVVDKAKLREVMLYIASRCQDDVHYGATKLNKILWRADFAAYVSLGRPITGETYRRAPKGPMAAGYRAMVDSLEEQGDATVEKRPLGRYVQARVVPSRPADESAIPGEDRQILDEVIRQQVDKTAKAVSDLSHAEDCWKAAADGEEIPYEVALVGTPASLTPQQQADANAIQREIDDERVA